MKTQNIAFYSIR